MQGRSILSTHTSTHTSAPQQLVMTCHIVKYFVHLGLYICPPQHLAVTRH